MDHKSFKNKYSRFDTPDIAEHIAEKINEYIAYDGIEYLEEREIHGRHTGYLDISSGGFRNFYDFLYPVLHLCRVNRHGVVSADIRKIENHLESWRANINNVSNDDLEYIEDADFTEDDSLYAFRNAAYNAELDGFMKLESPSIAEIIAHEEAVDEIWNLSSENNVNDTEVDASNVIGNYNEEEAISETIFNREYDSEGWPIYTKEEIEIYEKAMEDIDKKSESFLSRCREIFYGEGKEALHEFLDNVETYSQKQSGDDRFDDPEYISAHEIKKIRERFDVWDEEEVRLRNEKMLEDMQKEVDDYWSDPNRENRADWISPTIVQDMKDYFEERRNKPSFAEFVSWIRRGEFGILPEDYDGLVGPDEPGYYGE